MNVPGRQAAAAAPAGAAPAVAATAIAAPTAGAASAIAAPTIAAPAGAGAQPGAAGTPWLRFARFLIPLAAFMALAWVLAVGIKHSPEVGVLKSPLVGGPIPQWQLPLLTDPATKLGSRELLGQWYVLNFWGSWCYSCRVEHPELLQVRRSSRVRIIGVDWKDEDADAMDWLSRLGNPYNVVLTDHSGDTGIDLGVAGAPESFLVNPQGIIVDKEPGIITPAVWQRFLSRLPADLAGGSS
ncbi:MAG TPA: DsbE family thiol:disulfide interchange protein [Steroidobacteraceae bacterium]|nr:DsbE family thiol:disulfide interchange protein [Steroidobacteraceae bacterium]